ncbi:MAG: single-stranded DNA-binding protein [Actinomycetaceae bacterium]|nr:single-stranded DNA-binding protein [Actinomycetaceae bacterium]MDY6082568.1 single-stranded DNA-binding protein [Actinomycetaceae bacterium]
MSTIAQVIGNLTADPHMGNNKKTGEFWLQFTVASNVNDKKQPMGHPYEATFISVIISGATAEPYADILHKGSLVTVSGELVTKKYVGSDNMTHHSLQMLDAAVRAWPPRRTTPQQGTYTPQDQPSWTPSENAPF